MLKSFTHSIKFILIIALSGMPNTLAARTSEQKVGAVVARGKHEVAELVKGVYTRLPEQLRPYAGKVAYALTEQKQTDLAQIDDEQLAFLAQMIALVDHMQQDRQVQPVHTGDACAQIDDQALSPAQNSSKLAYMSGAYILYNKFMVLLRKNGSIGTLARTADYAVRAIAILKLLGYQQEQLMPEMERISLKRMRGVPVEDDCIALSRKLQSGLMGTLQATVNPDVLDEMVSIPLQLLVKTVPAALFHYAHGYCSGDSYTFPHVLVDASEQFSDATTSEGTFGDYYVFGSQTCEANSLLTNPLFKGAVVTTSGGILRSLVRSIFASLFGDKHDGAKVLDNWTLGLGNAHNMAMFAHDTAGPALLKAMQGLRGTLLGSLIPAFTDVELGFVRPEWVAITKDGVTTSQRLYKAVTASEHFKNQCLSYALYSAGGHLFVRGARFMLENKGAAASWLTRAAAWCGQGFVRIGLCSQNPVKRFTGYCAQRYAESLTNRTDLIDNVIGASYMLCQQPIPHSLFTDENRRDVASCVSDLHDIYRTKAQAEHLRRSGVMRGAYMLDEQVEMLREKLAHKVAKAGLIGKVADQMFDMFLLQDFAIGNMLITYFAGSCAVKVAQAYNIVY